MKENLVVTEKGQITLPVSMRRSLGLRKRSVVQAELVGGKIVLTPAMVIETELYSDEQVREWDKQDAFGKDERKKLESKLARRNIAAKYPQCLDRLDELIRQKTVAPQPHPSKVSIHLPAKDRPVYQAATAAGASDLLTSDLKHFGRHMNQPGTTSGLTIQTVADYLASR